MGAHAPARGNGMWKHSGIVLCRRIGAAVRRAAHYVMSCPRAVRTHLRIAVIPVLVLIASLAASWAELCRQDHVRAIELEALRTRLQSRDAELTLLSPEEYFEQEVESPSLALVGRATAVCSPIHYCKREVADTPSTLPVWFGERGEVESPQRFGKPDAFVETSLGEATIIKAGDRVWVYRVELPALRRRTGDWYGPAHERYIASLRKLELPVQLTRLHEDGGLRQGG